MIRWGSMFLVAIALCGCGEDPKERDIRQDSQCRSYGAKVGSPEYIQCRATLAKNEEVRDQQEASNALVLGLAVSASSQSASSVGRRR